jgi:hypothetical protein
VFGPDTSLGAATGAPHDVTSTQATFNGTMTPGGTEDSSYSFEYGPTTAYGSQTPAVEVGPGLASTSVASTVTGLEPATEYHYQLVVTDASGLTRYGGDSVMPPVVLDAAPSTVASGGTVAVTWSGLSDPSDNDWIGLYEPGAPDDAARGGFYADSCSQANTGTATPSGTCTFTMPASGGTYELRLYSSSQSGLLTSSAAISIPTLSASASRVVFGKPVSVSWTGVSNATGSDWIGLYAPNAPAGSFISGFFTDSCSQTSSGAPVAAGSCSFTPPPDAGTYELRLYPSPAAAAPLATSGALVSVPPVPVVGSAPTVASVAGPLPPVPGVLLECSHGVWANAPSSYAYAWRRDGSPIAGAAASSYRVRRADISHTVSCEVIASNAGGAGNPARSAGLLAHSAPPGTVLLGATLERDHGTVTVRFRATGAWTGVRCRLARTVAPHGAQRTSPNYAPCRSPLILHGLTAGSYVLSIRAVGPGGPDPSPAVYRFTLPPR